MCLAMVVPAAAQTVSSIVVEGNRRVETETIRSYFHAGPGGRLDAAAIDEGLKALYGTGLFEDVKINPVGGRLIVTVVEAPVINRVAFEGNKRVKDEQLTAEVQSKPRGTFSRAMVQADVERIVEVYRHSGRFDVTVNPKVIDLPNNRVDLVFEVTEGEKTTVREIRFVGNHAFGDARLKNVIKTTETNFLSFIKNTDIYDADRIEADRDLLRRFYLTKGYADVQIVSGQAEYDPQVKGFVITYVIQEGDEYHFTNVNVLSNVRDVDPESLRAVMKAKSGLVYDAEAIEKTTESMTVEMSKRGYPFSQVRARGDRDPSSRGIGVVFVVDEGPRAYVERINIRGNTRTRDYVIRREFDISEGDAYNKVLIDRAERRIRNLGYFKTVKVTTEPGSAPDRIIVDVDVVEQATGEFSVSGGYSTVQGFLAQVSIGERNLMGQGQYAKLAVTYGEYVRGMTVSYAEPYFMGYRVSAGIDIFANESTESPYQSYGSETYGFGLRLGFPLREDLTLQTRYNLTDQLITLNPLYASCNAPTVGSPTEPGTGLYNIANGCLADSQASAAFKALAGGGFYLISSVGYSLDYNTLDNVRSPTSGLFAELKQDLAGVGGDVNFLKTTVESRYYYNVYSDIVALLHLQGGYATPYGGQQMRPFDQFFGGPWLVRGFSPNGFGPRDLTAGTTMDNVGGAVYWGASLELQTPIPNIPKDYGLKFAAFADIGNVYDYKGPTSFSLPVFPNTLCNNLSAPTGQCPAGNQKPADTTAPRSSVGVGLLWDSPFGPLRIDYAIALTKQSYDYTQQIMFGGGTKF
jgi:outer membrane protein insertion porin family